ncbi:putative phage abortive infection protein [Paenibacillus polymyxa]|uniref:putative phage abortive infection protein n=1 Tax=Paenibacillus polymyxa TaxID=1406 RepID=UPI0007EC1A21|nr:putative phage abortive infection protein [Paenibacillus polymyxa]OAZ49745.1 hypothetical protein A9Z39_10585 [Paenibacillus polymyxa]
MKSKKNTYWSLTTIISVVVFAWFVLGALAYFIFENWTDRGTFGDMFGSVNVLFSGLAFASVMYTIHLQKQDLNIQREVQQIQIQDMKMQAQATAKSAEQLEGQQQLLNFQVVQGTVLNLINIKNRFIKDFRWSPYGKHSAGYDLEETQELYGEEAVLGYFRLFINSPDSALTDTFFSKYFRMFFYTLNFINESNINQKQKQVLADILSIETSDPELRIIYMCHGNKQGELLILKQFGFDKLYKSLT